jgi:para-nitrobenzyl esterase
MRTLHALTPGLLLVMACGGSSAAGATPGADAGIEASEAEAGDAAPSTLVTTDKGPVQGTALGSTTVFYSIPFAAPPVGDLRWKPPAPHATWTSPLAATAPGPECGQLDALTGKMFQTTSSEDCLTLNIWTPNAAPASPAPVMLWIFGGSFVIGSGGMPDYDGQKLSEATGAVVVTINYRLGPMGFLALSALHDEDPSHASTGMYGIEDQRAAIAWTHDNIAAFGGDPKNVTIFGESAGGISVCNHMVSPASKGLFQRAIIESGACALGVPTTEATAETQGNALAKALGCSGMAPAATLACLRGKPLSDVLLAMPSSAVSFVSGGPSWGPIVDGLNVPADPTTLFKTGAFAHVPTLLGTNTNEGTLFFALGSPVTSDATYEMLVNGLLPGKGAAVVAHYPSATYGTPTNAAAISLTDGLFVCPARRVARAVAGAGVPTYRYHFAHVPTNALVMGLGSFHSSEIPFVFGNSTELEPNTPTAAEEPLATTMMGYWGRMAGAGDPNGSGSVAWPKYDVTTEPDVVLDIPVTTETAYKKSDCDFWDTLLGL